MSFAEKKQKSTLRIKIEDLYRRFYEKITGKSIKDEKDLKEKERRNKEFV